MPLVISHTARRLLLPALLLFCLSGASAEVDQEDSRIPDVQLQWSDALDAGMDHWQVSTAALERAAPQRSLISLDRDGQAVSRHLAISTRPGLHWHVDSADSTPSSGMVRRWVSADGHWQLEQQLQRGDLPYRLSLTLELSRLSSENGAAMDPEPVLIIGPGLGEAPIEGLGIATRLYSYVEPVIGRSGGADRIEFDDGDHILSIPYEVTWAGLNSRYFALLLAPEEDTQIGKISFGLAGSPDAKQLPERYLPMVEFQLDGTPSEAGQSTIWQFEIFSGPKSRSALAGQMGVSDYTELLFHGLWRWMRTLSFALLRVLEWLYLVVPNWGLAICLLAVLVRVLLYPMARWALSSQQKFAEVQREIQPEMARIKKKYRGGEQSERILKLYEQHGVSPLAGLKPLLIVLIQIPIFVALFHVLGQAFELREASFLWMDSLAKPDQLFAFGIDIPFFGSYFNLLPVLVAITTLVTIKLSPAPAASDAERRRQNIFLGLMALAFFLLFYPFPSGMVLYWTMANVLHILQSRLTAPGARN